MTDGSGRRALVTGAATGLGREIALALVLFTDGTRIRVSELVGMAKLPGRLLGIGMPLIMLFGAIGAALMFTELSIWEAAIIGVILAPTDAGLGHAVNDAALVDHINLSAGTIGYP